VAVIAGDFRVGPDAGRVLIKTSRAGLAAMAGHDLTLEVTRWSARIEVPGEADGGIPAAKVTAELDLGSLAVREGSGGARPLTDADRRDIEATARKVLTSGGQAVASFSSSRIIPSAVGGAIEGTVTLNGRSQPARLQVSAPAPGHYRGSATIVQSAFGITPYKGLFGALKLRDEVVAEFDLDLNRVARDDPADPGKPAGSA
jgi:YceI-like domain